ncbi:phosphatidylethanolamine-binding protein [Trametes maxima]|nr:phosphatidylethanolamine-binding protein [Trametes maxima]
MLTHLLAIATLLLAPAVAQDSAVVTPDSVAHSFTDAKIVPDVLASFNPTGLLDVVFSDNTTGAPVNLTSPGTHLTKQQTARRPQVFLTTNQTSFTEQTFVLAMIDPDAPTPQNTSFGQVRHFLAGGLQANGSLAEGAALVNNTLALSDFIGPGPPAGSDPHRYVLLLFVQPSGFSVAASALVNASTPILNFNISRFAAETGLEGPIAGTYFLTGPDGNATSGTSTASASAGSATNPGAAAQGPSSAVGRAGMSLGGLILATVVFAGAFVL